MLVACNEDATSDDTSAAEVHGDPRGAGTSHWGEGLAGAKHHPEVGLAHGGKHLSSVGSPARRAGGCLEMEQGPPWAGSAAGLQAAAGRRAGDGSFAPRCVGRRAAAPAKLRTVDQHWGCQCPARVIQGTRGGRAPPARLL